MLAGAAPAALLDTQGVDRSRLTRREDERRRQHSVLPAACEQIAGEPDEVGQLRYDHEEIIRRAVDSPRVRYASHPDPAGFVGSRFTLRELQRVHEAVHGTPLMRDTFRRVMQPQLVETGDYGRGSVGKPASLFRRRARTGARGNASQAIGRRRSGGRHGSRTSRK